MKKPMKKSCGALLACFLLLPFCLSAHAATLTVSGLGDSGAGTLRNQIAAAQPGDTINFNARGTITLTSGELAIAKNLTIQGPGALAMKISGNNVSRVFNISSGTVHLSGLTISGGRAIVSGGGIYNSGTLTVSSSTFSGNKVTNYGGAIFNNDDGTLTVSSSTFSSNTATDYGAGIFNYGTTTVSSSTFSGNTAGNSGGGIYNSGTLTVTSSTLSANSATTSGGGIINDNGTLTVTGSTISVNKGGTYGGGIYNSGPAASSLLNSTLSGNTATNGFGGGIYNNYGSALKISYCTLSGNSGAFGGGIYTESSGTLTAAASVAGGNNATSGGPDISGAFASSGYNVVGKRDDSSGYVATDKTGTIAAPLNPLLGALADNGGPTKTLALLTGSPAIDTGNNATTPATDQRGVVRPQGTFSDSGAFEAFGLTVGDVTAFEGSSLPTTANFSVTLTSPCSQAVTLNYATANGTTNPATAGSDYTTTSGTLTFAPGEISETVSVTVTGDTMDEENETFFVKLSSATNAVILRTQGIGSISDDDAPPALSIANATVNEGNSGTTPANLAVTLSAPSGKTVTVQYATADSGSVPTTVGVDYVASSGMLTFAPGETSQNAPVQLIGDLLDEGDERFVVNLSAANNATIARSQAFGTIADDDAVPNLSINNVTLTEGNTGTTAATFTVTLSAPSSRTVTVQYYTATTTPYSAAANVDYVSILATTLTFAPGETTKPVTVLVNGDTLDEDTERFTVNLKSAGNATITDQEGFGTIKNDDTPPSLSINDMSQAEGNSGTTAYIFTVTLSAPSGKTVTVKYQTINPSSLIATPGSDYVAVSLTTLTFAPGQTGKAFSVQVKGDTAVEGNERFIVKLSGQVNATIADSEGIGTITNDDVAPLLFEEDAPSE